jgi:1-acyl-sn-glycerol-3-phosphate acyltransferase
MKLIRSLIIIILLILLTTILLPIQSVIRSLNLSSSYVVPMFYHRAVLKLLGIKIKIIGTPSINASLVISNHASWIDIFIISSIIPTSFVAKNDVSKWIFVSYLAKLQKTIFIDRNSPKKLTETSDIIKNRLLNHENVTIFPEGTSTDGNKILPFKTSIFMICEKIRGSEIKIQPISIAYKKYNGLTMGRTHRQLIAWYGDMDLLSHLYGIIKAGIFDIEVTFHNKIDISENKTRKEIAKECENLVRLGFQKSLNRGT